MAIINEELLKQYQQGKLSSSELLGQLQQQSPTPAAPAASDTQKTPTAGEMLSRLQQGKLMTVDNPLEEARKWEERQLAAAEKYGSRGEFKYDMQNDPLYQQYREQAMRNGRLSMMDTMGQARANNGGYGTSYSQMAGQQAYNSQLQTLNDKIPDLYTAAWNRYQNVGEDLLKRYQVAGQMKELYGQGALPTGGGDGGGGYYGGSGESGGTSSNANNLLLALRGYRNGMTDEQVKRGLTQGSGLSYAAAEKAMQGAKNMQGFANTVNNAVSAVKNKVSSSGALGAMANILKKTVEGTKKK